MRVHKGSALVLLGLALVLQSAVAHAGGLPDDTRLAPVRGALERTVNRAARDGLPAELIVSKVREGLAKGAPAPAIQTAAERLAEALADADRLVKANGRGGASVGLMRALADARIAGVEPAAAAGLLQSRASEVALARAVDVLTDMTLRGYPARPAAGLLRGVINREPAAVGRVVRAAEAIRVAHTVSRGEALELLERNMSGKGASLDNAMSSALEDSDRAGNHGSEVSRSKHAQNPGQGNAGAAKRAK